jgi:cation transport ATPase
MTNEEILEVISKGQSDGATLYRVADALYKAAIALVCLIGILGLFLTIIVGHDDGLGRALGVFLLTVIICALGYAVAIFGSQGAKVLVHILFSNLAILERGKK